MSRRTELQTVLESILGGEQVYFQPPSNVEMEYDCIVYERSRMETRFADNGPYSLIDRYQVTAIYRNPDSDLPRRIAKLPMCSHERHFTSDNLHHDVFNLYY